MVADSNRRGYQHLLEGFWDEARSYGLQLPTEEPVSAASFCTARHKITPDLLRHMLHEVASSSFDASFGNTTRRNTLSTRRPCARSYGWLGARSP